MELAARTDASLAARRSTFWTLLLGYGAYYLCRANLGIAAPLLQNELHLDKLQIGAIGGVATLVYALGKFTLGPTADLLGGKSVFLIGLAGAVVANIAFGFSTGLTVLIVIWSINRFAQSAGWMGLVKLVSGWYERGEYGVVMAWLSLSFLLGDVVARGVGAGILGLGLGWRSLFFIPAMACGLFVLVALRTLHTPPSAPEVALESPLGDPSYRVSAKAPAAKDVNAARRLRVIFGVLVRSSGFWMSCLLSFLLTFLRTVFLDWTVLFLVDTGTVTWKAALQSALFPLTGAAGTLFAGWYSDRVSAGKRGPVAVGMLGLLVIALALLALVGERSPLAAIVCIGAAGFLMLGPYSLLGGCLALDYGGKEAAATAAGINDGVGYLGGSASGLALGGVVQAYGWTTAFFTLSACSAVSFVVAIVFARTAERAAPVPAV